MKTHYLITSLFFYLLFISHIQGQEVSKKDDITVYAMDLDDILDVEVTSASKTEQKQNEAPNVINVITKKQISQNGWISLNDILYKQQGYGPTQDFDRHTVSTRGFFEGWNNNHLLMLIDGIPVNDNLYGTAYTSEITPLNFVKNIESIRGPGSALYGSNAMNGVIQINTLSPKDLKGGGEAQVRVGNNGLLTYDFITGIEGEAGSMIIGINAYENDGVSVDSYDGSGRMIDNVLQKYRTRDDRSNHNMWSKFEGKGKLEGITLQYLFQNWNFQTGHGWLWFIPDVAETMNESRHIIALKYNKELNEKLKLELVTRYQLHNIDWNMRYYPDGAFDGFYQAGMWEYLNTNARDVFSRIQFNYSLGGDASLLGGIEHDIFLYEGDKEHYSNINLVTFDPIANNSFEKLGPWFEYVKNNRPVNNLAFYTQFNSGNLISNKLKLTLGARFDTQSFKYLNIGGDGSEKKKSFSRFTPRAAIVFLPNENLSLKAMWGIAFRTPSPTEMFGSNTFTLASNIDQLEPEKITTAELALDYRISKNLNLRANVFHAKFENQIAYSTANANLSTNILTGTNAGLETELLYHFGYFSGFLNYTFVTRLDETILDNTITESDDLTWDAPHKLNFGVNYSKEKFTFSLLGHYNSSVKRKDSDIGVQTLPLGVGIDLDMTKYRGNEVPSWTTFDLNVNYQINKTFNFGSTITNVFNNQYFLVKNLGFPFDYEQDGRRVIFYLKLKF